MEVLELVESMVANPGGAPKAMKQQFAVFVREDGTVDFDKAVETGKEVRAPPLIVSPDATHLIP